MSVSGRSAGIDAGGDDAFDVRPAMRSALRSVLRRCEKAADTVRANAGGTANAGSRRTVRRATADQTRGAGVNAPGPTSNRCLRLEPGREHDGEAAVRTAARRGRDAVDDFLLQHDVQVVDVSCAAARWNSSGVEML